MPLSRIASKAGNDSAGIVVPIRSVQTREGRNEIDAAVVGNRSGQRLYVGALLDKVKVIPQPLHKRAGDRDASFECILSRLLAKFVGDGCEKTVIGMN